MILDSTLSLLAFSFLLSFLLCFFCSFVRFFFSFFRFSLSFFFSLFFSNRQSKNSKEAFHVSIFYDLSRLIARFFAEGSKESQKTVSEEKGSMLEVNEKREGERKRKAEEKQKINSQEISRDKREKRGDEQQGNNHGIWSWQPKGRKDFSFGSSSGDSQWFLRGETGRPLRSFLL